MKQCVNCGNIMDDDAKFCPKCGKKSSAARFKQTSFSYSKPSAAQSAYTLTYTDKKPKKKRAVWITILLWISFWPIMLIITIAKAPKIVKPIKAVLIGLVVIFMITTALSYSENSDSYIADGNSSLNSALSSSNSEKLSPNTIFSETITDETLRTNFLNTCAQIGMDYQRIENLEQVDDWISGPRYSFSYEGMPFRLYCNMDSTVNAIRLGTNTDIYKQGFEPYQISDYMIDISIATELQLLSEEYVKNQLNYPSSADFPWLDWAYGRDHELYSVSSSVTAQNAFGMEDKLPFTLIYQIESDTKKLVYFELGGSIIVNQMDIVSTPERKEIPNDTSPQTAADSQDIVLVDGELGTYGKTVDIDGFSYINYCVPEGTYIVLNNGKWCKVYLAKDEYYKNSDGYTENEIVETLEFSEYRQSQTLTVKSGEHLELTINASVTLTPIE